METYEIIRSARRTLALEITTDCRILVRAPQFVSDQRIAAFVAEQQAWIVAHLARQRQRGTAPPHSSEDIAALKAKARAILPGKVAHYGTQMGLTPTGIKITTAQRRYGSCNAKNSLCFSCFLMEYPEEAIDLVVVHELAHIREKNHGSRFYALLAQTLPDWKERKKKLR